MNETVRQMIAKLVRWFKSMERPYIIFMPRELRIMQALIEAGADPDEVKGVEKLWLWRFAKRADAFADDHRKFYAWLEKNHPEDFGR